MVEETTDNPVADESIAAAPEEQKSPPVQHVPVGGSLLRDQTPTFWKIMLSFLSARYIFKVINATFFRENNKVSEFTRSSFYPYSAGTLFLAITGRYSAKTLKDIKDLSAETLSYETGKPTDQIGYLDLFKSKNRFVQETMKHMINRSLLRFGSMLTFFIPWHKFALTKDKVDSERAVDAGVGVLGLYLGFDTGRRATSYERWVSTVAKKINKRDDLDSKPYDVIDSNDISMFLIDHYNSHQKGYIKPSASSPEGEQLQAVSQRIADLMNMTYGNTKATEPANFTDGKMFYMVDMLDKPYSMGYVELANKSKDMSEVKAVSDAIGLGADPRAVFAQHGIDLNALPNNRETSVDAQEPTTVKFADKVIQTKDRIPQAARTPQEFAEQSQGISPSL